jgi:glutathione S-transferase
MTATLFVIPGSHPSMAARKMLEAKGIAYKRRDLIPVVSKAVLRASGFPGVTVPALKIDGEKVQGTGPIARHLDKIVPSPQLVPDDPDTLVRVEAAEEWGDHVLQPLARRITWNGLKRKRAPMASYSEGAKMGVPVGLAVKTGGPIVALSARFTGADDDHVRKDFEELPKALDKVDSWIKQGVIGGSDPNIADYQIAPSLRLLSTMDDVRPAMEGRPALDLAMRLAPDFPGHMPPVFPDEFLEPIRAAA